MGTEIEYLIEKVIFYDFKYYKNIKYMNRFYKLFILLCFYVGFSGVIYAQNALVLSEKNFQSIKAEASRVRKPFLVFFYEPNNSGCASLENKLTQDGALSAVIKRDFVYSKTNVSANDNGWEGAVFLLGIETYPCIAVFKKDGTPSHLIKGDVSSQQLMADLETVKGYMAIPNYAPQEGIHFLNSDRVLPITQKAINDFVHMYDIRSESQEIIASQPTVVKPSVEIQGEGEGEGEALSKVRPIFEEGEYITESRRTVVRPTTPSPAPKAVSAGIEKPRPGDGQKRAFRYVLQFNSFDNEILAKNNTIACQKKLPAYTFFVVKSDVNGGIKYRVVCGDFDSLESADLKCKEINRVTGLSPFANRIAF